MKEKIIIFDVDGTIADTFEKFVDIVYNNSKKYTNHNLTRKQIRTDLRTKSLNEIITEFKISKFKLTILVYRLRKELRKRIDDVHIFDGMGSLIKKLKKNHTIGIITSNDNSSVQKFLKNNDLDIFDFIYSKSSLFGKHKILEKIIKKKSLKREDIFYVGDEVRDIEAAKLTRINVIAVTWGFNSKSLLEKYKPDYIVDKSEDIIELIKNEK